MMQLQNLTLTLLLSLLLFLSLGCGEETESPATPPAIDDPQILTPQAIAEVFTEALGREVTIDDLIEKDNLTEKPESTQRPDHTTRTPVHRR